MDAIIDYIKQCLTSKYFRFRGRASRGEFWSLYIFVIISVLVGYTVFNEFNALYKAEDGMMYLLIMVLVAAGLCYLVIPTISATVRRLHDIGKSGWWILVSLIPSIGQIILFILCLLPSEPYDNSYGRFER